MEVVLKMEDAEAAELAIAEGVELTDKAAASLEGLQVMSFTLMLEELQSQNLQKVAH